MPRALTGLLALCALCACPSPVAPDAGPPTVVIATPDAGDPTAALFAPNHVIDVRLELPPSDWETLRHQTRDLFTLLAGDCVAQPFPSPFTTFEGVATIDGQRLERTTIKKKGFLGSLSTNRPSLKLKFDALLADQQVSGLDAMTLNNAQQDPALVRQCLGYALFAKAGLLAPRCSFAHVRVNSVDLGVYVHVEAIDKDFLRRRFPNAKGNLFEGTLSDFNATFVRTFDLKSPNTDPADLSTVLSALAAPDAEVLARLEAVLDLNQFIDFWAMETLLRHWDGYAGNTNNFFLYDDPTTHRFVFIPWGADAVFTSGPASADNPEGLLLRSQLAQRLYALPSTHDRYLARLRFLLDTVLDEPSLRAEVLRMQDLVAPLTDFIQRPQLANGLADVRRFIDTRRAKLNAVLANPPTAMAPTERPSPCLARLGSISATFSTTWGTLDAPNPFTAGTGTLDFSLGAPIALRGPVASTAGLDLTGNDGPRVGVNVFSYLGDGGATVAALRLIPARYPPVGPQPFDLFERYGVMIDFSNQVATPVGIFGNGTLAFEDAGTSDGALVTGHFSAEIYRWPFGG